MRVKACSILGFFFLAPTIAGADANDDFRDAIELLPSVTFEFDRTSQAENAAKTLASIDGRWANATVISAGETEMPEQSKIEALCELSPIVVAQNGGLTADVEWRSKEGSMEGQITWVGGSSFRFSFSESGFISRFFGDRAVSVFDYGQNFYSSISRSDFVLLPIRRDVMILVPHNHSAEFWVRCE